MPRYWLVKTEPTEYSFEQLMKDKQTVWEGVSNPLALKHLRAMEKGDLVLVYHTGNEKAIVGIAEVSKSAYPDPRKRDARHVVIDLKAKEKLQSPVTLASLKAKKEFASFDLVRIPRLSVMPVEKKLWELILRMSR